VGRQAVVVVGILREEAGVKEAEAQEQRGWQDGGGNSVGEVGSRWVRSGADFEQWILRQRKRVRYEGRAVRDGPTT
jgi:hypothetical protein